MYIPRVMRWLIAYLAALTVMIVGMPIAFAGPTVIGVNGTTVHIPMLAPVFDAVAGALEVNHGELKHLPGYDVVKVDYPASLGLLTLGGPGYDKSVDIGVQKTVAEIKKAQNGDSSVPVKLACYSQGADVCTQVNDELASSGYDQSSVSYLLFGNVDNAEAGVKVRFPYVGEKGVFIPLAGLTLGSATPTTGSDAQITQLLYEYDGFARAPEYPLNLLADLNAMVGAAFEHGAYRWADPYSPDNIVSTTPDGKITNIMIPVDEVPLLTLARFLGMPRVVANILNPTVKAIIDTAYGPVPNGPGTYPTEATPFKLFPSKEKRQENIENVRKGLEESVGILKSTLKLPSSLPVDKSDVSKPRILPKPTKTEARQPIHRRSTSISTPSITSVAVRNSRQAKRTPKASTHTQARANNHSHKSKGSRS